VRPVAATGSWLSSGVNRLRTDALSIVESVVAATAAWLLDVNLLGHPRPFFAPATALIALGATRGQRARRALEIVIGVAMGVLIADLIARGLGPHTGLTIAAVTALALIASVFVGGGPILAVQASVSGIYVAVVAIGAGGVVPTRFIDALVGGGVALLTNQLPLHRDPVAVLITSARPVFDDLATVLEQTATALERHDRDLAFNALQQARSMDVRLEAFRQAVTTGLETLPLDPLRRRRAVVLDAYDVAVQRVDFAVRNVRVLARAAVTLTRSGPPAPPELVQSLQVMREAVHGLGDALQDVSYRRSTHPEYGVVRDKALAAVRLGCAALRGDPALSLVMIVGQLRSMAVDLLIGSGQDLADVLSVMDEAQGLPEI